MNSLPTRTWKDSDGKLQSYTPEDSTTWLLNHLCPSIADHKLIPIKIVIRGREGSGKTTLQKALAEKIVERYGIKNVNVFMSDDLRALIETLGSNICPRCNRINKPNARRKTYTCKCGYRGRDKEVQVLIIDDLLEKYFTGGAGKEQKKAFNDFRRVCHILEEKTGQKTGIVITIWKAQEHSSIKESFREVSFQIFKTYFPEEEKKMEEYFGSWAGNRGWLNWLTNEIFWKYNHSMKSYCIALFGSDLIGCCCFPPPTKDYAVRVGQRMPSGKVDSNELYDTINHWAEKILKEPNLIPDERGFNYKLRAWLIETYPTDWASIKKLFSDIVSIVKAKYASEKEKIQKKRAEARENIQVEGNDIYTFTENYIRKDKLGRYGKDAEAHAEVFKCSMERFVAKNMIYTQGYISEKLGLSQPTISNMWNDIRESVIGWAFEDFYIKQQEEKGNKCMVHSKLAENDPDYIDAQGRVKSLKCRFAQKKMMVFELDEDCKPEWEAAVKGGYKGIKCNRTFSIIFCNLAWKNNPILETEEIDPNKYCRVRFFEDGHYESESDKELKKRRMKGV